VSADEDAVVIAVFGEGKADVGKSVEHPLSEPPTQGVLPVLVSRLCDRPKRMQVKCFGQPFMTDRKPGRKLWKKALFARRQAFYRKDAEGVVFVVDSEGELKEKKQQLEKGREAGPAAVPMAIGVAHPCIEAWLLADAGAIRRAMDLSGTPAVPPDPETLPAGRNNAAHPKNELRKAAGSSNRLSAKQMSAIAKAINDVDLVRARCPRSFAPFAEEVHQHIRPLF